MHVNSHANQTVSYDERKSMLNLTAIFLIIALLAAVLGAIGVATVAISIAKICFVIFMVLFFASVFLHTAKDI